MLSEKPLKALGNLGRGLAFVISAPAGTGKTSLVRQLADEFPCVVSSISYTTRPPRQGETQGVHYNFISEEEFEQKIAQDDFLEYVRLYGFYYGTSRSWVEKQLEKGKHVVLVIDTQGALKLQGKFKALFIFVIPPSLEELRNRLLKRQTENLAAIEQRLLWVQEEMQSRKYYDYLIVNDDFDVAYNVLKSILIAEEHRMVYY